MKKILLIILSVIVVILALFILYIYILNPAKPNDIKKNLYKTIEEIIDTNKAEPIVTYNLTTNKENYKEYNYSITGETLNNDSTLAFKAIRKDPTSLSYGANEIDLTDEIKNLSPKIEDDFYNSYMVFQIGENQYTFDGTEDPWDHYDYAIYKNDQELLDRHFCFPTKRAEFEFNIYSINDQLALTFDECFKVEGTKNEQDYTTNLYYAGEYINDKYGIKNTTRPFVWNNKLGFFTEKDDKAYLYYDGLPISADFTGIHTFACCADFGLLPKLFDNGVLVFAAGRNKMDFYIVEVKLN